MNSNLGVVMFRTLTASVMLAIFFVPTVSFSDTTFPNSVQAEALWPGGMLGLNLTGAGYDKIGMWNGAFTHPYGHAEYTGRMILADPITMPAYRDHDTQTAGIIISSGLNALAKGVAYEAELKVFDQKDITSEISTEVTGGMEIGSLSYGYGGYSYDNEIDEIAYNDLEQNFLFFQAAGNGTDLYGQGKNILSVGSINVDTYAVTSSIGPSADGRIKPDVVGPGGPLWSCIGTIPDGYGETGAFTSFSTPTVAGFAVLLQQHFDNIHGTSMSASTLKGILIHTADEYGTIGPDTESGWGYVNARSAAELITLDSGKPSVIMDGSVNNSGFYDRAIYSDGTEQLKVTLTWTDPPTVTGAGDYVSTMPTLVNDLDLVLLKDGVPTHFPWVLSGASAVQGENDLDNVEQVYIANPTEGIYTIHVDHDGALMDGSQTFSLIVTGDSEEPISSLRGDKNKVLNELEALYPTGVNRVDWRLSGAINYIKASLADALWEDENYLTKYGAAVFNRELIAAAKLNWIVNDQWSNIIKTESLDAIISLVSVDKMLARLLIDKAIANNGDETKIGKALAQMEIAQQFFDQGKYSKAINRYKFAWWYAHRSLVIVGLAKYGTVSEMAEAVLVEGPVEFSLDDNYPNPFNPTTTISFNVPEYSDVSIEIYNLMGEKIRTLVAENRAPGNYQVRWNGTDNHGNAVSTGMYFYELRAGDFKQVKRMTFMK